LRSIMTSAIPANTYKIIVVIAVSSRCPLDLAAHSIANE
jgi:hypothetical protein